MKSSAKTETKNDDMGIEILYYTKTIYLNSKIFEKFLSKITQLFSRVFPNFSF